MASVSLDYVCCPNCASNECLDWAEEKGFTVVRCVTCQLLYVNPRPVADAIDAAVTTGVHANVGNLDVRSQRIPRKIRSYRRILRRLFGSVWKVGRPIVWLDVGAGYGEIMEAVAGLAPAGSQILGVEPMEAKAKQAIARGLQLTHGYLKSDHVPVDFVSLVDVFSHIPQFADFLIAVRDVLKPGGELFIETGNLADIEHRLHFPGELGLPDHLVFAGERQIRNFLERGGFEVLELDRLRIDGVAYFAKNIIKAFIGRSVRIRLPYTSRYRRLLIRARKRS